MADESFARRLLHAIDAMIAPKDKPKAEPTPEIRARRAAAERSMTAGPHWRSVPDADDEIGLQVDRLRRRRKVFSLGTSDEPSL